MDTILEGTATTPVSAGDRLSLASSASGATPRPDRAPRPVTRTPMPCPFPGCMHGMAGRLGPFVQSKRFVTHLRQKHADVAVPQHLPSPVRQCPTCLAFGIGSPNCRCPVPPVSGNGPQPSDGLQPPDGPHRDPPATAPTAAKPKRARTAAQSSQPVTARERRRRRPLPRAPGPGPPRGVQPPPTRKPRSKRPGRRPCQTVPAGALSDWAAAVAARLAALDAANSQGSESGLSSAVDDLLALPGQVLIDPAASRGRSGRVCARLVALHDPDATLPIMPPVDPTAPDIPADDEDTRDSEEDRRLAARLYYHLSNGSVSRAAKALSAEPVAAYSDAVLAELQRLHPDEPLPALPDQITPAAVVKDADLTEVLRNLPRGSAAGPSGWTYEHVRAAATTCPAAREAILRFINLMVSGGLPRLPALLAARVVALQKPGGRGIRPLAVGEVWLRMAGLCALQAAPSAPDSLPPLQLAVGVRGGAQCLGHGVSAAVRSSPTVAVLQVDWRNPYNEVRRSSVLSAVADRAPSLLPFAAWSYGGHSPLHVCGAPSGPPLLASRTGVRQGDPIGPLFFALTLQPALEAVQAAHPDVAVVAYADDVFLVGAPADLPAAFRLLVRLAGDVGLTARPEKCCAYSPAADIAPLVADLGVSAAPEGIVAAGTPIGTEGFVRRQVLEVAHQACARVQTLQRLPTTLQAKHSILQGSFQHALTHLARALPADVVLPGLDVLHTSVRTVVAAIWEIPEGARRAFDQVFLPIRHAGMGYHRWSRAHCHAAFVSGAALAHDALGDAHRLLRPLAPDVVQPVQLAYDRVRASAGEALGLGVERVADAADRHLVQDLQTKFGKWAAAEAAARLRDDVAGLDSPDAQSHQARIRSCADWPGSSWLVALPTRPATTLADPVFRSAGRFRLGLSVLPRADVHTACLCGKPLTPDHPHSCDKLAEKIRARHDIVVQAWCRVLRRAGFATSVEPPLHSLRRSEVEMARLGSRGDILAVLEALTALDVSVTHPSAVSYRARAAREDGAAAAARERRKRADYRNNAFAEDFFPLAQESFGRLGAAARRLVLQVGESAAVTGLLSKASFVAGAYTELSVALCKGNERVFRTFAFNLAKVAGFQFTTGDLVPSL